jgi:paraquat-inducible protein B
MNEESDVDLAKVQIKEEGVSWLIWLLPAIALLVGLWLIYKSTVDAGIEIIIYFDSGAGVIPHKTEVRYEGVPVGIVNKIDLSNDLKGLNATVEIKKSAAPVLQEDTVFWMVEPEISITRVTGLDTLVSGRYITFQFGETTGKFTKEKIEKLPPKKFSFIALNDTPVKPEYLGGLRLTLSASSGSSITKGAPILHKKIAVGNVERIKLGTGGGVEYEIYVQEDHKHFVNKDTRFWNTSGLSIQGNLSNIEINMDTFTSLMIGGISFTTPENSKEKKLAANDDTYELHMDKESAFNESVEIDISFKSGEGLVKGTLVKYNGITIGEVTDIEIDSDFSSVRVSVNLTASAKGVAKKGSKFWIVKPKLGLAATKNVETLLTGRYITVEPSLSGPLKLNFMGLDAPPTIEKVDEGLKLTLAASQLGSIKQGVKVYYRNIAVGKVAGATLAENSKQVLIYIVIEKKYAPIVKNNTRFWNASGFGVDFSLFSGAKIRTQSLESLLEGGLAFATPNNENMGEQATEGDIFQLYTEPEEDWLTWSPDIPIK